ncbi:hypothetical protein Fmac_024341 [Flemingia macrophylla]|uniref:Uncharacterized protein n=1 Tax=Flemingia macrophylla TaxID=520843 RepID=A0ABD1LP72_9FABA
MSEEELWKDQGQSTGISTSNPSPGGTSSFGLDVMISNNPNAYLGKSMLGSMGPNYAVSSPTGDQGTVSSLGNGNYHLPTSKFTAQVQGEPNSSSVQLPQTQESSPQQQEPMGIIHLIPYPHDMGESSSRNVKMKMTLSDDNQPSTELQMGSLYTKGNEHPQPSRPILYSLYDPMYEQMGFYLDPHLRMFFGRKPIGQCSMQ